jgi:hypothetical protein
MYRWSGSAWVSIQDQLLQEHAAAILVFSDLIDGTTTIFYQTSAPTSPASNDLWYDTDASPVKIYRWTGSAWSDITNSALATALANARTAQATADGKIRTFAQTSAPTGMTSTDVGDLWIDTDDKNKLYRYSGTAWVAVQDGNISELTNSISSLSTYLNSSITIFYQTSQPTATATGDVWYDTDSSPLVIRRWTGSAWIDITTTSLAQSLKAAADAQSTADGKIKTYAQPSAPTGITTKDIGDLWIDTDDKNKLYRWNGSSWAIARDTTLDAVDPIIQDFDGTYGSLTTIARNTAYTGSLPPTDPTKWNSWINTGVNPPEQLRWTGYSAITARNYSTSKTGATANIPDPSNDHALNITVKTVASQSPGTASPTTPRTISGKTSIGIRITKKNINPGMLPGAYLNASGVYSSGTSNYVCTEKMRVSDGVTYVASNSASTGIGDLHCWDAEENWLGRFNGSQLNSRPTGTRFIAFNFNGVTITWVQVEVGSTATAFEAYSKTDHTLTSDSIHYGISGYEDEISNSGSITHKTALVTLDNPWTISSVSVLTNHVRCQATKSGIPAAPLDNTPAICSHFVRTYDTSDTPHFYKNASAVVLTIPKSVLGSYDAAGIQTWLGVQQVQVLYQIATNVTATFAPIVINNFDGINNISSNGSSMTINYTGSGWELVSGKANSLYASATQKFDANGLEITQTAIGGQPANTKFKANTHEYGLFRTSDDKVILGSKMLPEGRLLTVTQALTNPDVEENSWLEPGKIDLEEDNNFGVATVVNGENIGGMYGRQTDIATKLFIGTPPRSTAINGMPYDYGFMGLSNDRPFAYTTQLSAGVPILSGWKFIDPPVPETSGCIGVQYSFCDIVPMLNQMGHIGLPGLGWEKYYGYSTSIASTSDEREKHDLAPVDMDMMARFVMALDPTWYRLDALPSELMVGFKAQQFKDAMTTAGMPEDFAGFIGGNPNHLCLDYGQIIAPLVSTVQAQQRAMEFMQSKIDEQSELIASLSASISRIESLLYDDPETPTT